MKKIIFLLVIFVIMLSGCDNKSIGNKNNISSPKVESIEKNERLSNVSSEFINSNITAKGEDLVNVAYNFCNEALVKYYKAMYVSVESMNFDKYIENENLKDYLKYILKVSLSNSVEQKVETKLIKSQIYDDYVILQIQVYESNVDTPSWSELVDLIVIRENEKLKIVDWHIFGTSIHDALRQGTLNTGELKDPIFWNKESNIKIVKDNISKREESIN